jgi:hypothetical protein
MKKFLSLKTHLKEFQLLLAINDYKWGCDKSISSYHNFILISTSV